MVARLTGAGLGLLAFSITLFAGLVRQDPAAVVLSRGIFSLFLFCGLGLVVGAAAQAVVSEHLKTRESAVRKRYAEPLKNAQSAARAAQGESVAEGASSSA